MQGAQARRSLRSLFAQHYSLLARKVAERSAETGEHYITTSRDEYRDMLRRAAGGGLVIAGTTFAKFALGALALTAFWSGLAAGLNYALSFVIVHLLHWTVATKQPAMTAPAMADKLSAQLGQPGGIARRVGPQLGHHARQCFSHFVAGLYGHQGLAAQAACAAVPAQVANPGQVEQRHGVAAPGLVAHARADRLASVGAGMARPPAPNVYTAPRGNQ